jgi:uncharacterized protein (DUF1499 family)
MTMTRTAIIVSIVAVLLLPIVALALMSLFSRRPPHLGVTDGRLAACPSSPNCVCSQATDKDHQVGSLELADSTAAVIARLKTVVESFSRAKIVEETDTYLCAEFTSGLFRFTDDVEFLVDDSAGVIHVRSASRTGHSDLGANRTRVDAIRNLFDSTNSE